MGLLDSLVAAVVIIPALLLGALALDFLSLLIDLIAGIDKHEELSEVPNGFSFVFYLVVIIVLLTGTFFFGGHALEIILEGWNT